ncbi:MAG: rod shape-determining protein MreC [Alphaproteobacteria bacterium]|nr:rod shape-determining protein MreC [Alphaproteobacteria bacterium]
MRRPTRSRLKSTVNPMETLAQRVSFVTFLIIGLALFVFSKFNPQTTVQVQSFLTDAATPVLQAVGQPVEAGREGVGRLGDIIDSVNEMERLREQNERLQEWRLVALRLSEENERLRGILRVKDETDYPFVTARVISDPGGPFLRAVLVTAGRRDGVERRQPVMDERGLVGHTINVGAAAARVLLITDLNSRVPIVMEETGVRAVMEGDNSARPRIAFLPVEARIKEGERVLTSGDGGLFPPFVLIGRVVRTENGPPRIQPSADLARLGYVRIFDYSPPAPPSAEIAEEAPAEGPDAGEDAAPNGEQQ